MIHRYELIKLPNGKKVVESVLLTKRACFDIADSLFDDGFYSEAHYYSRLGYECAKNNSCVWEVISTSFDPDIYDIPAVVRNKIIKQGKWPVNIQKCKWTYYVHLYY